jgi:SAM-dependent methyltransferase
MRKQQKNKNLQCPICKTRLHYNNKIILCNSCEIRFPVINGIPVLINESNSLFTIDSFINKKKTTFDLNQSLIKSTLIKFMPKIGSNIVARKNLKRIVAMLPDFAKILIIGGSISGKGMEVIYKNDKLDVTGSDVSFGPRTDIISDGHDIPFEDETFDCVIVQAVLEHVINPSRVVSEVYRVLKRSGLVYSEIPFMQSGHMREYDFNRFTYLGNLKLFNKFKCIDSGPCCGSGMALAWSIRGFFTSFTENIFIRRLLIVGITFIVFPLKYFDYLTIKKSGTFDTASAFYFIGKRSDHSLGDKDILKKYTGMQ